MAGVKRLTDVQCGQLREDRGRLWSDAPTIQEMSRIAYNVQKLGRGKEGFFLRNFIGSIGSGDTLISNLASRTVRE